MEKARRRVDREGHGHQTGEFPVRHHPSEAARVAALCADSTCQTSISQARMIIDSAIREVLTELAELPNVITRGQYQAQGKGRPSMASNPF